MRQALQLLAGAMSAGCVIPYIRDIFRGTTRPHRVSWFAFALLSSLAAAVQFRDGLAAGAMLTAGAAIGFTTVFLLSLEYGTGGATIGQRLQLVATTAAAIAWLLTQDAELALVLIIVIEVLAIVPTVRKAYNAPTSETTSTWIIDGLSGVIAALTAVQFTEAIYPIHHVLVNATVVAAIAAGNSSRDRDWAAVPRTPG
ncbi:MAG TPA: hypothetical protein VES40_21230 [Ilumatobacteraceae bacterium]|nr:hypothetical protein [Ilumatobacteraceae bacterium]